MSQEQSERGYNYIVGFFFIRAFATKSWEKSRIFKYGLPEDFF